MGRPRPSDAAGLFDAGLRAVLTLTEEPPLAELRAAGFSVRHEPIPDFAAPDAATLARCVSFVETMLSGSAPVVVHCFAGYGRTGTVLAAVLAASGMAPDDAIREIRTVRPGSIETWEQEAAVRAFAESLGPDRRGPRRHR
jgi:atypical dual specificity phosphatase